MNKFPIVSSRWEVPSDTYFILPSKNQCERNECFELVYNILILKFDLTFHAFTLPQNGGLAPVMQGRLFVYLFVFSYSLYVRGSLQNKCVPFLAKHSYLPTQWSYSGAHFKLDFSFHLSTRHAWKIWVVFSLYLSMVLMALVYFSFFFF